MNELVQLDHHILLLVNGLHCPFFDYFMHACSDKLVWIPLYVVLFFVMVRTFGWRASLWGLVAIAATITLTDQLTASLIRPTIGRLRPANLENPLSAMVHIVDGYRGGPYGFPSSHASNTAGLAFFIVSVFRQRALSWFMVFWMLLVCYSRMYLGVHFLGDLLVGGFIGFLVGTATAAIYRMLCLKTESPVLPDSRSSVLNSQYLTPTSSVLLAGTITILAMLLYATFRLLQGV